jgi:NADH-quinone oxidoreductase subunit C
MSDENSIPTRDPLTGKKRSAREMMALREAAGIEHPGGEKAHAAEQAPAEVAPPPPEAVAEVAAAPPAEVAAPLAPESHAPVAPTPEIKVPSHDPGTGKKLSAREKMALREKLLAEGVVPEAAAPTGPAAPAAVPQAPAHPVKPPPPKPTFAPFPDETPVELSPEQTAEAAAFEQRFGEAITGKGLSGDYLRLSVAAAHIADVADFARERGYNYPTEIIGSDLIGSEKLRVSYVLTNIPDMRRNLVLQVAVPREDPRVPTVSGVYQGADWPEREAYDLLGIIFEGHPDLRRIMLPDEWEGHPLRKDYSFID